MKQVFAFDLDDTLFCWKDYVFSGFDAVGAWLHEYRGIEGFSERCKEVFGQKVRGNIFDLVFGQAGLDVEADFMQQIVSVYRCHMPLIQLYEDARAVLRCLRGEVYLALITDGIAVTQENKVYQLGLESFFDAIVYTDKLEGQASKPSPKAYRLLMDEYFKGIQGDAFVYIGDNPLKDFTAANALGWETVRIQRPEGEYANVNPVKVLDEPKHTINSLSQLVPCLQKALV